MGLNSSGRSFSQQSVGMPRTVVPLFATFVSGLAIWHVGVGLAQYSVPAGQSIVVQASSSVPIPSAYHSGVQPAVAFESTISPTVVVSPASYISVPYTTYAPATISRNWALEVANAKTNLNAQRLPEVAVARQRLDQAMMELENFLATSPQHQANWLAFLDWKGLTSELSKAKPDEKKLVPIEKLFRQNFVGLEMRQFTNVRDALTKYIYAVRFSEHTAAIEELGHLVGKLSDQLQMPNFTDNFANTREIGQTVNYLSQSNQAPELVSSIRSYYSRANVRVLVSNEYVTRRFSRPVHETNPVNENILGTQIYGNSVLDGWVTPQLLDSSNHASMRLNLNAGFSSQNIGYNRSVKLHTQGAANICASESIALTDHGLVALNDTQADAGLRSQINEIEAKLRIVRRIASNQAAKQKPEADAIAEGRLENRIRNQFHQKLAEQISQANQKLKTPELPVLARLGLERPKRTTWSSPQYLALLWKLQEGAQLAAPTSCPLVVEGTGIAIQLHESAITNLLDPVLAGRVIKSTEMDLMATQFGGALGTAVSKDNDDQPWSIALDMYHPIEIEFDNSLVTFRIRTTRMDRGDQSLIQTASIEASYRVVLVDGTIDLVRQGEVKIDFTGKQQRGVRAVTLRTKLKSKFDALLKERILDKPIRISDKLPSEARDLHLASITMDDGWIQVHLR